jgi:hypothetical protein
MEVDKCDPGALEGFLYNQFNADKNPLWLCNLDAKDFPGATLFERVREAIKVIRAGGGPRPANAGSNADPRFPPKGAARSGRREGPRDGARGAERHRSQGQRHGSERDRRRDDGARRDRR